MQQVFEDARKNMVDGQVLPNKITDPALIEGLRQLPREKFVPAALQNIAYLDEDIALGNGRFMQEPMVLSRLLQAAEITRSDVALDIGCATGYATALMANLAGTVVGLEPDAALAAAADNLLRELGVCNIAIVQQKDLREGYAPQGPYNVIRIGCSVPEVPQKILAQLADGGRLVTVISKGGHMGTAVLMTRRGDAFTTQLLFDAAAPTLPGFESPEAFVF